VLVPNREPFVYVRLRSNPSEVIEAYNDKISPSYKLPVLLKRENNRYIVFSRDDNRYQNWEDENPFLPRHGDTHSFDKDGGNVGSDPVFVYPYQFMPSLVSPFGSAGAENLYIFPTTIHYNGDWKYVGNTGTASLVQYNPTSGSCILLISLDGLTGNPNVQTTVGTYIPISATGTADIVSYLPSGEPRYLPLTAVRLVSGTTSIGWNNLYDVRQFLSSTPTGTSGGGVSDHNDLTGLQGGGVGSYFHLSENQYNIFISGSVLGDTLFQVDGDLAVVTGATVPYLVTKSMQISQWYIYCGNPGTTGSTIYDVNLNGTSIFTTQANRPELLWNDPNGWAVSGVPDFTNFVAGDVLTLDIDQVALGSDALVGVGQVTGIGSGGGSSTIPPSLYVLMNKNFR
jgi:hypothetical protein